MDGSRPLRRFIAREADTGIGRALIAGRGTEGVKIRLTVTGSELTVTTKP